MEKEEKIKEFLSQLMNLDVQLGKDEDGGNFIKFMLYEKKEIPRYKIYFTKECVRWEQADKIIDRLKHEKIDEILQKAGNNNIVLVFSNKIDIISKEKYKEIYKNN